MFNSIYLGVNIDHVATVRQARGNTCYPDPLFAAQLAENAGADAITVHLREDRRHIQERDVLLLKEILQVPINFEMAATEAMITFACSLKPKYCCVVPERREEITTEGGLDVVYNLSHLQATCDRLSTQGLAVSLFIDPEAAQVSAAKKVGASAIELHTGRYALAKTEMERLAAYKALKAAAQLAQELGLRVNAGHGLHYHNVGAIAAIPQIVELNIGHAIVAQALFVGFEEAVRKMKGLMQAARVSRDMRTTPQLKMESVYESAYE